MFLGPNVFFMIAVFGLFVVPVLYLSIMLFSVIFNKTKLVPLKKSSEIISFPNIRHPSLELQILF